MSIGDCIFIGAVCMAPLPLIALLLCEFAFSFRRPFRYYGLIVPGRE